VILKVDTGIDVRTIVSGIAESFKPEDIVGKSDRDGKLGS
jgi:methionyl-tRNA synthetase